MGAPVVWFEVAGSELDTLKQFYGNLFGWRIDLDPAAPAPYGLVDTGAEGGIPGGIYAPGEPVGSYVSFYVAVDDLEESLRQAETLGAKVAQPPTPLPDGNRSPLPPRQGRRAISLYPRRRHAVSRNSKVTGPLRRVFGGRMT